MSPASAGLFRLAVIPDGWKPIRDRVPIRDGDPGAPLRFGRDDDLSERIPQKKKGAASAAPFRT